MTILLTTHYLEEADRLASRLAIVDRGRVVAEGTPDQLKPSSTATPSRSSSRTRRSPARVPTRPRHRRRESSSTATRCAPAQTTQRSDPAVLAALEAHGVTATSVTFARPSLDDVYLRHAGRTFHTPKTELEEVAA